MEHLYIEAKKFLLNKIPSEQRIEILDSYLELPDRSTEPVSIPELFERLLKSAQNANMKSGVIGKAIGGVTNLKQVLFDFDPTKTLKTYEGNPKQLLDDIEAKLKPHGKIRKEPQSIWPKYCKTILSIAEYLSQFKDGEEFYNLAKTLYENKKSMPALPLIISEEIEGLGYPLACDFLKELGFIEYGKPDVHVIDIFSGVGLCNKKPSPYQVQKIITKIAESANVSPYNVDKLFWLIGSGKFYKHENLGKEGKIGRSKQEFIEYFNAISNAS